MAPKCHTALAKVQFFWKATWHNWSSILKVFMLLDFVIPLLGICPEEMSRGSDR